MAILGREREAAAHDLVQSLPDTARPPIEDRSAPHLGGEVVCRPRGERPAAMKRLVHRHAERELIGAVIDALAPKRLDRQVSRRPCAISVIASCSSSRIRASFAAISASLAARATSSDWTRFASTLPI